MKKWFYSDLLAEMQRRGDNLADVALGRMMDIVEEEPGEYPSWSDAAPEWVVRNALGVKG